MRQKLKTQHSTVNGERRTANETARDSLESDANELQQHWPPARALVAANTGGCMQHTCCAAANFNVERLAFSLIEYATPCNPEMATKLCCTVQRNQILCISLHVIV